MIFKKVSVFLILLICFFISFSALAKSLKKPTTIIFNIDIKTKNKKLKTDVVQKLAKYKNKKFSKDLSHKIYTEMLNILKTKKILLPKITGPSFFLNNNKVNITYTINNPYKYGFILKGNKVLDRHQLLLKRNYEKYFNNHQMIRKILSYIKSSYLEKGYMGVNINHQTQTDNKNFLNTVLISIKEGAQTKIEEIKIFGSFSRKEKHYIKLLKNYSSSLIQKNLFYNADFQVGLKNLVNSLKNEGYLNARAHARITNSSPNKVIIEVILNEGPLTLVQALQFDGNKHFSHQKLTSLIKTKVKAGLNISYLEKDIQALKAFYREQGFIEMTLNKPEKIIKLNRKESTATLHFNITEGFKIKAGEIVVRGNKRVKRDFILKNLYLKKGEVVTPKKIELSINKLRNSGLFSTINILTRNDKKAVDERALIIQVEENKPRSLRFGLGINTERTLTARGFAEFSHKNIAGTGRRFSSRLKLQSSIAKHIQINLSEPEYLEHQISVGYTEPFLLGTGFNGQLNISNESQIFTHNKNTNESDIVNSTEINLLLHKKFYDFLDFSWKILSWEGRTDFLKTKDCPTSSAGRSSAVCKSDTLNIATTGVSLKIDKRDNILFASDGFLSQLTMEYSGPFYIINSSKEIKFLKMEVKHFDFRPIFNRWVLTNSIYGGFITNMNSAETGGFPVSRAFILGGVSSLRGFDGLIDGERVPDKEELPIESANELIYSRSSFYVLFKTELRFSISKNFTGSLFYDGGIVTISGKSFSKPYRHSAGLGVRYKTPLGPIAGYVALKISPKAGESSIVPHLSFGSF